MSSGTGKAVVVICYEPSHGLDRALDRQDDGVPRPVGQDASFCPSWPTTADDPGVKKAQATGFVQQPQHEWAGMSTIRAPPRTSRLDDELSAYETGCRPLRR